MRKHIIIMVLCFTGTVLAKDSSTPFNLWFNTGIGLGTNTSFDESAAAVASLTTIYQNISMSIRYALNSDEKSYCGLFNADKCADHKRENYLERPFQDEKAVLWGVGAYNDFGTINLASGVSHVTRKEQEEIDTPRETNTTFGIPIELQANIKGAPYFAYGIYLFYNFNHVKTFGGIICSFQIGYLK